MTAFRCHDFPMPHRGGPRALAAALLLLAAAGAQAAPFEIAVLPSRFEVSVESGKRLGQSLEIQNLGAEATTVALRTLDWHYSEQGEVSYYDALQPGSCRPWVTLERKTVSVPAHGKASFRFQIDPPADAKRGECRFMIAIEGVEPAYQAALQAGSTNLSIPVQGRIAVAVYAAVDGAEPKLELRQVGMRDVRGKRTPYVLVHNSGAAHGRVGGSLDATDAAGKSFELVPEGTPVMPGQTRQIALLPKGEGGAAAPVPTYPVKASGLLDWDRGSFKVDTELR